MESANCLLYDWFTVSFKNLDYDILIDILQMRGVHWSESERGSKLRYKHRLVFDGISIHYSNPNESKYNQGCCLEMSGQGCRDFETYGSGDWNELLHFCICAGGSITRVDIAYDDFTGVLPLPTIADFASKYWFTAQSQHLRIMHESVDKDPDHMGISVCHGSKFSAIYIRIYDKRVEKQKWDVPHWVRCEVQLRKENALGFLTASGGLGVRYRGVIANYLLYKCPSSDSNMSRRKVAPFWNKFLEAAAALSVNSRKDVEYNKTRLEHHIYDRNHNSIRTCILSDGLPEFLEKVFDKSDELPEKYTHILEASQNADEILRILGETETKQIERFASDLQQHVQQKQEERKKLNRIDSDEKKCGNL